MKLTNLQSLRFIAAMAVFLHHLLPHYQHIGGGSEWIISFSKWSFSGVDLFFVLSGYIISSTLDSSSLDFKFLLNYLYRRFLRIFTGYWPLLILTTIITYIYIPNKLEYINFLGSIFLLDIDMSDLILPVSWSLSFELCFYFMAVMSLLFFKNLFYIPVLVYAFFIIIYSIVNGKVEFSTSMMYSSPFFLEFLWGLLAYKTKNIFSNKNIYLIISIVSFPIFMLFGVELSATGGLERSFTFGLASFCLIQAVIYLEKSYKSPKTLVFLGDSSYSLYLCHLPFIWILDFSGFRSFIGLQTLLSVEIYFLIFIVITVFFSSLYYVLIERPLFLISCNKLLV